MVLETFAHIFYKKFFLFKKMMFFKINLKFQTNSLVAN